jgi:hypothetical protein
MTWEAAIAHVATSFARIREKHGRDDEMEQQRLQHVVPAAPRERQVAPDREPQGGPEPRRHQPSSSVAARASDASRR